jgi:Protein of unknown function (DUF3102)
MTEIEKRNAAELETLAEQINAEHRAFIGTFRKTLEHGIRAGELLSQAKEQSPHGTWLSWLAAHFEGAPRTAQEYMQLYKRRAELRAKTRDSAHLSVSGALKELAAPKAKDNSHPGLQWERAYRAWKEALRTPEEGNRLAALQELDRRVRPADLLPGRLHGAFAEELTGEEMSRTFDELIRTGAIANWETTRESHLWRMHVIRNVLEETPEGEDRTKFIHDVINAGSVRPHLVDAMAARLEKEKAELLAD